MRRAVHWPGFAVALAFGLSGIGTGATEEAAEINPRRTTRISPPDARGAPAGMFTAFPGAYDCVFAGTSAVDDNIFHVLDPFSGIVGGVQLESAPQVIGAPSLDSGYDMLHVGSEAGILYAVEVPF